MSMENERGCLSCDLIAGRRPLPGGVTYGGDGWVVEHCVGPLGAGTVVVLPVRHVVHVADLNAADGSGARAAAAADRGRRYL
jgi:hypothetical protein